MTIGKMVSVVIQTDVFDKDLYAPPPIVVGSVKGLYPLCVGQLLFLELATVQSQAQYLL
jgi:hypothetical protein